MESEWRYYLTQKADDDLDNIIGYIAMELSNPKAASDFLDQLQEVIEEARSFPESGSPVVNEYLLDIEIRKKMVGNYIMYYLPDFEKEKILILRIVYGRRNMDEILRKLDR